MYAHFLYFIIVILIISVYQPADKTNFSIANSLLLFFASLLFFVGLTWSKFRKLEKQIPWGNISSLDKNFNAASTQSTIIAIIFLAFSIYGLNLPDFLNKLFIISLIPTLSFVIFLGLFMLYLSIIWRCAHRAYQNIYRNRISIRSYIISNISLALPVILPWLLLTLVADMINLLPFESLKKFMGTMPGEILYFLVFLLFAAFFAPVAIKKFWRCRPIEAGKERYRIESLCKSAGLEFSDILYWPIFGGKMITAGIMGLTKKFRYILITPSLLKLLNPDEVDAVVAHEIGHVKKHHLIYYLLFFVGYLVLSYTAFILFSYIVFYIIFIFDMQFTEASVVPSILFNSAFIINFIVYFRFIFGFFMRNFERQADVYVFSLFKSAGPLITTFEKISLSSGQSPEKPNWHHFSITERISFLKKCERDKTWVDRHDRKIKLALSIYFISLLFLSSISLYLQFGKTTNHMKSVFFEKMILKELENDPENPHLYGNLGDVYYGTRQFEKAVKFYETSLAYFPDNPKVLNNLAWLLATCPDETIRRPTVALKLAEKAASMEESYYILDTLAESYYVNGLYKKAVITGQRALELAEENRPYYEQQIKKFKNTAKGLISFQHP